MHKQYFSPATLDSLVGTAAGNRRTYSYAVAVSLAGCLQLPSSPVESPQDFFMTNLQALANKGISVLNEVRLVDIDLATEVLRQVWLGRYYAVFAHAENIINFTKSAQSPLALFGISLALSPVHECVLLEDYAPIFKLARAVTMAVREHNLLTITE